MTGPRQHAHRRAAELGRHLEMHRRRGERVVGADEVPSFHVGVEWIAVFVCLAIVARRRNLFPGLVAAVAIVVIAREAGLAAPPL